MELKRLVNYVYSIIGKTSGTNHMGEFDNQQKVQEQKLAGGKVRGEGCLLPFSNDIIPVNSLPPCALLEIKPSELKNGEKRQGTRSTAALLYLMARAEQTEGLASMR